MDKDFFILSKNHDAYLLIDLQGNIEYASENCKQLLGYSIISLQQSTLHKLFITEFLNQTHTFFKCRVQEKLDNFDAQLQGKEGSIIDVNITSMPIYFEKDLIGSYLVLKDITFIKKHKLSIEREKEYHTLINELSRLSEKHAIAGQLAAGIAHEIRNPITAIKGFLQLLMGENDSSRLYYDVIFSEIDRIEVILKELLVLAKPTKQKYERLLLQDILEHVVTLMLPQANLNNVQIEKEFNFKNTCILGDGNQLKQVFINYIKNAIEAMLDGGVLRIQGSSIINSQVNISFIDQGPGIPLEILKQIGQPFFSTKENGTGLGMLVSRQIIKEHKGDIHIDSDSNGSSVHVKLPVCS
ncbi:ATP-binding protein [Bacillus sp. JJ664]